jgi:hypothetical protein
MRSVISYTYIFVIVLLFAAACKRKQHRYLKIGPTDKMIINQMFITPFKYIPNSSAEWLVTKLYEKEFHIEMETATGVFRINLYRMGQ